ncbi:unnamed protein product [Dicrocoelium dendriticum]|nr:unnamed protein product [Dicrocoelium dendriticum]
MLLFLSLLGLATCSQFRGFTWMRSLSKPPAVSSYEYEVKYIDVLLDHFTFVDGRTFQMKYLISKKFHVANGPIFFYAGNEGAIETFAENSGFIWEKSEDLKAAVVFAEHRFYGSSLPFGNDSFKDAQHFGYLTAEQAIADYACLIQSLRVSDEAFKNSPVIAFGGSYGGMLAAWFRNKYPNLIAGSVAASAPVWLFPNMSDCGGFYRNATNAFALSGGEHCTQNIRAVWKSIRKVAEGPSGLQLLRAIFVLCDPLLDAQQLIDYLVDYFGTVAMVNYPYPASFIGTMPANPVAFMCKSLDTFDPDEPDVDIVRRVASAVRSLVNYTKDVTCVPISSNSSALSEAGWDLQTCLEMTTPMCADGVKDMFPASDWDPEAFSESCNKRFGVRPRMDWSNVQFWGKHLHTVSNVVFSNGDLDPWSAFGVLNTDYAPSAYVIRIPSGAHHLDLRAADERDPQDVIDARLQILGQIKKWIDEWNAQSHI